MKKNLAISLLVVLPLVFAPLGMTSGQGETEPSLLAGKIICLDPGHGGTAPGAVNEEYGLLEKHINLDVAKRLETLLVGAGATVVKTRDNDETLSTRDRYTFANNSGAEAFVSIHTNSYSDPEINGTETYYFHGEDIPLAQNLQDSMVVQLGIRDRGIKKAAFGVLLKSKMPSAEVEPVFMSNPEEAQMLQDTTSPDCRRQQIAQSLYDGLNGYFKYLSENPEPEKPGKPENPGKGPKSNF